jgi:hypothetical protein
MFSAFYLIGAVAMLAGALADNSLLMIAAFAFIGASYIVGAKRSE